MSENEKNKTPYIFKISKSVALTSTKQRMMAGAAATFLLLLFVLFHTSEFFRNDVPGGAWLYIASILCCPLIGLLISFRYNVPLSVEKRLSSVAVVSLPIGTILMAECLNGGRIGDWGIPMWCINCVLYALLFLFIFALSGKRRMPFLIIIPLIYLLAISNYYVMRFRGTPLLPIDLFYAKTATTVAGKYDYSFTYQAVVSTIMLVLMMVIAYKIKTYPQKMWKRIYYRVISGLLSIMLLGSYFVTDIFVNIGLVPFFFDQARGYQGYGVTLSFFMNTRYLSVDKPDDYNASEIEDKVYKLLDRTEQEADPSNPEKEQPNIICIMNESLCDLSVLGEFNTNKDYMPFLHNLTENTVKGNLYVPVIGGGTCDTEFEFLTGSSTAFLPSGSKAYSLYIDHNLPTLTTTFNQQGYSSTAFHPFEKSNWNRVSVYENLGFDSYLGLEDISDKIANDAQSDKIFLRDFISDDYDYQTIIELYEEKQDEGPFYVFNVTMQNHGGYEGSHDNFEQEIYLTDDNGQRVNQYPQTNQYLSLIYESDKAIQKLVNYFSQTDEPTIICIFGDHQPTLENDFLDSLVASGKNETTAEQKQARCCTPFYIWANYDIEEKEIDMLSANYLSSYLLSVAGADMPLFNQYLLKLSEIIPVINTVGYIDSNGIYYEHGKKTEYTALIADYEKICYNYLFDDANRCDWLYSIKKTE